MNNTKIKEVELDCELFKTTHRILCLGGSNSGKTYMLQSLILRHHEKFKKIIICGSPNHLLEYPQTRMKTILYENETNPIFDPFSTDLNIDNDDRQTLLIIDDLMTEIISSALVNKIYLRGRHLNLSVVMLLQSYHPQGCGRSILPSVKNNADIQIFFKLRNRAEMSSIGRKMETSKKDIDFFNNLVEQEVYNKKHGYICCLMDEHCKEAKYRNNLVFEDGSEYETVFVNS